ncbi:MAG: DUF4136 domain-containing protein [Bacteroidetes bacterium]|nr:DUF4136 domain-containing protein [Bacteroidota bacterium]
MKNKFWFVPGLFSSLLFVTGCSKDPLQNLTPEESRIYTTSYDSSANFQDYKTFSIADSVAVIDNGVVVKQHSASDEAYLNAMQNMMEQRGYLLVDKNQSPDIAIAVNRVYNTTTGFFDYGDYWDYYGGYWDPYYWGYGGYGYNVPFVFGVYQITEGLYSIDMFDLKNATTNQEINLLWNGLVRGEGVFNVSTATEAVNALFAQSPYLNTTH